MTLDEEMRTSATSVSAVERNIGAGREYAECCGHLTLLEGRSVSFALQDIDGPGGKPISADFF